MKVVKRGEQRVPLKGFRDMLPDWVRARDEVVTRLRSVCNMYGFQPMDTPLLESLRTLVGSGSEETTQQLFRLESPEGEPIALRFDLTVPLARFLACHVETLKLPFRRCHIGSVFRADKPDPGRLRQFTQFDIDIAGCVSVVADAEIIAAMCEALSALDLKAGSEFRLRFNHRKLMDVLLEACGICEAVVQKQVLRVIDKLDKIGRANVATELGEGRVDASGDVICGVGLDKAVIDRVLEFIAISGDDRRSVLGALAAVLPDSEAAIAAVQEVRELLEALESLHVSEASAALDPSLTRGLDYYTGPVFEAELCNAARYGSVMGGGRFDCLVERFLPTAIPATGGSIGVDRLMDALEASGKLPSPGSATQVLIVGLKGVAPTELLKTAQLLRGAGIATEVYMRRMMGSTALGKQLAYANARHIPIAVILGEDEVCSETVSVKDLVEGSISRVHIDDHRTYVKEGKVGQITVPRKDLVAVLQRWLRR